MPDSLVGWDGPMTFDEFSASLRDEAPPPGTPAPLRALWRDGKGDWAGAHDIAQDIESPQGAIDPRLPPSQGGGSRQRPLLVRAGRTRHGDQLARHRMEGARRGDAAPHPSHEPAPPGRADAPEPAAAAALLPRVAAVRYVTPLREGGSVPALVEADDGRLYVVKLRGAGQGARALVAELIAGRAGARAGAAACRSWRWSTSNRAGAQRARPRDPGHPARERRREPGPAPPATARVDLRPGRAPRARRRRGLAGRRARRVRHQRRPHAAQPELCCGGAGSWRRSITAPRCTGSTTGTAPSRARAPSARSRWCAITCCCPGPSALDGGRRGAGGARARPTTSSTRSPPRSPTTGWRRCRARPTPAAQRDAYAGWLRARRAAHPGA